MDEYSSPPEPTEEATTAAAAPEVSAAASGDGDAAAEDSVHIVHRSIPISPISLSSIVRKDTESAKLSTPVAQSPTEDDTSQFSRLSDQRAQLAEQRVRLEVLISTAAGQVLSEAARHRDYPSVRERRYPAPRGDGQNGDGGCAYIYTGQVHPRTGLPHGMGEVTYANGRVYRGSLQQGRRHGFGEHLWPQENKSGSQMRSTGRRCVQVYRGEWQNGTRSGRGTHEWLDYEPGSGSGDRGHPTRRQYVTGTWRNGHLHGRACMVWRDGSSYDGDVFHGKKHGRGIQTWKTGKVYSGQYRDGVEDGYGTLTDVEKHTTYRGHFMDGKRHGAGIQMWKNKTYDGQWVKNVIQGHGKLTWKNGARYTGHFIRGKFHGGGCYIDNHGNKYIGNHKHGKKDGSGEEYYVNGDVYSGSYLHGIKHGYGRLMYADGSLYAGGWEGGKKSDRGIKISADGLVEHCGRFTDGKPVFDDSPSAVQDQLIVVQGIGWWNDTSSTSRVIILERIWDEELRLVDNFSSVWEV